MANFATAFANIRISNKESKRVCSVTNVLPTVSADTAAAFVDAIEKIYNNGDCTARFNVAMDI